MHAQMLQNHERTRAAVRSSISKNSTISDKEHWLALTEDDFLAIQWKMDRIDQKLADLYRNWQAEYRNTVTTEDCEEVKRFYEQYLENMNPNIESSTKSCSRQIDKLVRLVYFLLMNLPPKLPLVWLHWMTPRH